MSIGLLPPNKFSLLGFPNLFIMNVPDKDYFRNVSCALNYDVYVFILSNRKLALVAYLFCIIFDEYDQPIHVLSQV